MQYNYISQNDKKNTIKSLVLWLFSSSTIKYIYFRDFQIHYKWKCPSTWLRLHLWSVLTSMNRINVLLQDICSWKSLVKMPFHMCHICDIFIMNLINVSLQVSIINWSNVCLQMPQSSKFLSTRVTFLIFLTIMNFISMFLQSSCFRKCFPHGSHLWSFDHCELN